MVSVQAKLCAQTIWNHSVTTNDPGENTSLYKKNIPPTVSDSFQRPKAIVKGRKGMLYTCISIFTLTSSASNIVYTSGIWAASTIFSQTFINIYTLQLSIIRVANRPSHTNFNFDLVSWLACTHSWANGIWTNCIVTTCIVYCQTFINVKAL